MINRRRFSREEPEEPKGESAALSRARASTYTVAALWFAIGALCVYAALQMAGRCFVFPAAVALCFATLANFAGVSTFNQARKL